MKSTLIAITAALALAPFAATGAHAQNFEVEYDRAELRTQDGPAAVHRDIARQARKICKEMDIDLRDVTGRRHCVQTVVDIAVEQIGDARLTAAHEGREVPVRFAEND